MRLITGAVVALAAAISTGAHADTIAINGALVKALTFTPMGQALEISSAGFFGSAQYGSAPDPDIGVVIFGSTDFTTEPLMPGAPGELSFFPIVSPAAMQTFQYTATIDPDNPGPDFPDQLKMTITWNQLINGGEPELDGIGLITESSGDTPFVTDFPVGGTATVRGFFPTACSLAGVSACDILAGMEVDGFYEGGDATPASPGLPPGGPPPQVDVPEPMSSFAALGMALFCLWSAYLVVMRRERGQSGLRVLHAANA